MERRPPRTTQSRSSAASDVDKRQAPRSILEAMLNGLCVISTNVGGIPYLGTNGQEFLLVPPGDHLAMADAIRRILTEPELASRLSSNAHKKVEQDDWSIILPEWEKVFLSLINHE